jgi:hypothetical protein
VAASEKTAAGSHGGIQELTRIDDCYRINENDANYHAARKTANEEPILASQYQRNLRLAWEKRQEVECRKWPEGQGKTRAGQPGR